MTVPKHNTDKKNRSVLLRLALVTVLMFGFGFALVPLYDVFCDITGLNGKTSGAAESVVGADIDESRTVTVQFLANNNEAMPWTFTPLTKNIVLHPGEIKKITYYAKNTSSKRMVAQAIPSVSPGLTAQYLRKTECFCFSQQWLDPGESIEMPVVFTVDTEIPEKYKKLTLSYTLFDADGLAPAEEEKTGKIM